MQSMCGKSGLASHRHRGCANYSVEYTVQSTVNSTVQCTVHKDIVHCRVYSALYSVECTVYSNLYSVLYKVQGILQYYWFIVTNGFSLSRTMKSAANTPGDKRLPLYLLSLIFLKSSLIKLSVSEWQPFDCCG